jgi:hypothetical protein
MLALEGQTALIVEVRCGADGSRVSVTDPMGGAPQSIEFDLSSSSECEELLAYARALQPSRIEFFDPIKVPFSLVDLLLGLRIPYHIVIADAGLLGRSHANCFVTATRLVQADLFVGPRSPIKRKVNVEPEDQMWIQRWREIAEAAEQILVPCEQAWEFALSLFPKHKLSPIAQTGKPRKRQQRKRMAGRHLGLLPVRSGVQEHWLVSQIARDFRRKQPNLSMTVFGTTLDDLSLMQIGNVHVTGPVEPSEFHHLARAYDVQYLFASMTRPLFGHPILFAASHATVPIAYFDWSMGRGKVRRGDLALHPSLPLDAITAALSAWMAES